MIALWAVKMTMTRFVADAGQQDFGKRFTHCQPPTRTVALYLESKTQCSPVRADRWRLAMTPPDEMRA
jgi:hypothetical protein